MLAARAFYRECWELTCAIDALDLAASCLEGVGEVLVAQGEVRTAAELWGKAAMLRADLVAPMPPIERISYAKAVARAREQLGDEEFRVAWMEEKEKPLSDLIV